MKFLTFTLALINLYISHIDVQAFPYAGSPTMERRATVSNGVTCYFRCPDLVGNDSQFTSSSQYNEAITGCSYGQPGESNWVYCLYDTESGEFRGYSAQDQDVPQGTCPDQADMGGCGVKTTDREFKKRSYNLGHVRDNKAIADRQFKYPSKNSVNSGLRR